MTQASYDAYISSIQCCLGSLGNTYANQIKYGSCEADKTAMQMNVFTAMFHILKCYELQTESESEDNPANCITPEHMKCISQFLNKLCGGTFCIDFILTT